MLWQSDCFSNNRNCVTPTQQIVIPINQSYDDRQADDIKEDADVQPQLAVGHQAQVKVHMKWDIKIEVI